MGKTQRKQTSRLGYFYLNSKLYEVQFSTQLEFMQKHIYNTERSTTARLDNGDAALGHPAKHISSSATPHGNAQTRGDQAEYVGTSPAPLRRFLRPILKNGTGSSTSANSAPFPRISSSAAHTTTHMSCWRSARARRICDCALCRR